MTPDAPRRPAVFFGAFARIAGALAALILAAAPHVGAQPKAPPQGGSPAAPAAEQGTRWQELKPGQRNALKPLERDWGSISANQKQKWLEVADRFPLLQPDEKSRVEARMAEWARLTPEQRTQARVNFQQAKEVSPLDRRAQWEAYQSLPAEERRKLAARANPASAPGNTDAARKYEKTDRGNRPGRDTAQPAKSNIVPNPAFAVPPKPVAPTVQQAQPGATTTLISKRPVPPPHQQTGLPKIAASPNFVDKATLLPQRGPQGAAAQSASASSAGATQR